MTTYDIARNAGATHDEARIIGRLSRDGMLHSSGGLHAEKAGIPYDVWRKL
jgi:hypothetical protein